MSAALEHLDPREVGELRALFFAQAGELLEQVQAGLLRLERDGADAETLRTLKRALHTVKGDAASMGFDGPGRLCHRLEDVLLRISEDPSRAAAGVEVLLAGVDALGAMLAGVPAGGECESPGALLARIDGYLAAAVGAGAAPAGEAPAPAARACGEKTEVLRVEAEKVDRILDLVGELIIGRSMLEQAVREARAGTSAGELAERVAAAGAFLDRAVGDLQKGALRMRMVPLRYLFKKFPRVVRDLAHQLGKSARLEVEGQETELDKGIVDALFEPLTHLVRNMVDHGVESPQARRAAGKPEEGLITLRAYQEAARVVVEVADDGAGIDTEKLVRTAVERGVLDPAAAAALDPDAANRLLFVSGLSTADGVTATSGRGVGMEIVKSALDGVKGSVEIESRRGAGTLFRLRLPMTLAVIRTLLFEAGGRLYALPVGAIAEVARVRAGELTTVDGAGCLVLRGQIVSVIGLGGLLGAQAGDRDGYVLVLALRGRRYGLLVERLRWQQELVIKPVDERWVDAGVVAGASILGDGRVVLILDAPAVVARAVAAGKARLAAS